jgi:1-acyl-sn-glycerol-3-phosphate acyltransferase
VTEPEAASGDPGTAAPGDPVPPARPSGTAGIPAQAAPAQPLTPEAAPPAQPAPAQAGAAQVGAGPLRGPERPARSRTCRAVAASASALLTTARRTLTTALLLAAVPSAAALLVVVTVVGAPVSLAARGPWRATRLVCFALLYLVVDLAGLLAGAALFLRRPLPGPGARARRATDAFTVLTRLLAVLRRAAERLFRLDVRLTPGLPDAGRDADVPLLFLVRHAGLGDSFLLLQILLGEAGLRPHTVLKGILRADPCLDVLLGRVPHRFLPPARGTAEDAVAGLAAGLRPRDALVIFPEGGNFTPGRHRRAVARLLSLGRYRWAARAARLRYVLPPRPGGSLAALAAAPGADVVFVAHAGLDTLASPRAVWSQLPLRRPVRVHWWRVAAADIPPGDHARGEWLLRQWERIDRWTAEQAVAATPHS